MYGNNPSQGQTAAVGKVASSAGGPWALIPAAFNAIGGMISANEQARKQGEQLSDQTGQQEGFGYSQSPVLDKSNFEAGSPATTGANLIGDFGRGMGESLFGGAIKGEADMYSPNMQTTSGYAIQPTDFDSSSSSAPYQNSAMMNYLNYMSTRRGY
jgi:hypothetical protein